jgi:hypothetical protein
MDRKLWVERFSPDGSTAPWPCPACGQLNLTAISSSVHTYEGRESARYRSYEEWEPGWIEARFICMLQCACEEYVSVTGRHGVEEGISSEPNNPEAYPHVDYEDYYEPLFFHPALRIVNVPKQVPRDVRDQLIQSFAMFWCDLDACANRIRTSIEKLLNHRGVKRTTLTSKKKRIRLNLHDRIELFGKSGDPLAMHLMALKRLGNAGSHSSPMTRDDILDAYEIMEFVLHEMFDQPAKRVSSISNAINKTGKPRSASRKRRYTPPKR